MEPVKFFEYLPILIKNSGPEEQALASAQRGGFGRLRTNGEME